MDQLPPWVTSVTDTNGRPDGSMLPAPPSEPEDPRRLLVPPATAELFQEIVRLGPRERDGLWLPARLVNYVREISRRRRFLRQYSWSVPTPAAIAKIAAFVEDRRLLEVGAGSGLWAKLLSEVGVTVTATDDGSWSAGTEGVKKSLPSGFSVDRGRFYPVQQVDGAGAVRRHADHEALLLCWPPYERPLAIEALSAFRGDELVYIGDWKCTADDFFRVELATAWQLVETVSLPTWPGINDTVYLYRRRLWNESIARRPNPHLTPLQ